MCEEIVRLQKVKATHQTQNENQDIHRKEIIRNNLIHPKRLSNSEFFFFSFCY